MPKLLINLGLCPETRSRLVDLLVAAKLLLAHA
jgi:hypothetical protein